MKPQVERQPFSSAPKLDSYVEVISAIQKDRVSSISVPDLSNLLGVNPTTLNARFRRQQIAVRTIGRTNFVPLELALDLAELHKYSLIGWPTVQQASQLTGVKTGTIKARCEKGQLEGHIDLTKRLRINPAELGNLRLCGTSRPSRDADGQIQAQLVSDNRRNKKSNELPNPARVRMGAMFHQTGQESLKATNECAELPPKPLPFVLPPAPEPEINIITGKDYGLLEIADRLAQRGVDGPGGGAAQRQAGL